MFELARKHIVAIVAAISLVGSIVGTAYAVDARYMKVSDYELSQQRMQIQDLEDKIFELDLKPASDPSAATNNALKKRYRARLESLRENGVI